VAAGPKAAATLIRKLCVNGKEGIEMVHGRHKTQSPGIIRRMSSVERKCIVVRDYMHAHSEGKMRDSIMKKRIVYFLDFSCAFCTFSCDLITFFTILASSTRKARMMRDLTQSPHLEPPYARRTVFTRFETVAYWRGRRAGMPGREMPQSPHLGDVPGFLMWW